MRSPSRSTGVRTFASTRPQQLAIEFTAAADQVHGRNAEPFLIDLARERHGARTHPAHIGMMRAIGQVERRLAASSR